MRKITSKLAIVMALLLTIGSTLPSAASADELKYYLGSAVNAGKDTGYSESSSIVKGDPHWDWTLGEFYVSGFSRHTTDEDGNIVFLKTVGDTVTLWFDLKQDITKLNGNKMLSICSDTNGYDEYFGIEKTDFGRGTLIIRHTDYQNHTGDPVIYTDYLAANATTGAAVEVEFFEEGDYEVALNYEVRKDNVDIFGWNPFPSYYNYRIFFRFSVRNGNCMVYPFDVTTGAELTNSSITENGFYLDLAKSRYLDIDIKKEIRTDGAEGLTEDVRFNKPAKDGEEFTDEGIYTITVHNKYTDQTTTKVIYVGTDDVLKAHVVTGLSISDIEYQLALGATVAEDGTLIPAPDTELPEVDTTVPPTESFPADGDDTANDPIEPPKENPIDTTTPLQLWPFVVGGILLAAITISVVAIRKKKNTTAAAESLENDTDGENGGDDK